MPILTAGAFDDPRVVRHDAHMKVFLRLWTGIVAAVAGAALALLAEIVGMMTIGLPVDWLIWLVASFSGIGFVLGVLIGPRTMK